MLKAITLSQIYVLDQNEALDFYVGKLGMEVKNDINLGFMRWLTVGMPGDPNREVLLEVPGPPALNEATADQVRQMVTKGASGGWLGFTTDDCRATYDTLLDRGVEFTQEPVERFYGIDCGLRDPFGNAIRITQFVAPAQQPAPPRQP
jgi:catechol 2,3-dioxygenase-like lactoylglutathione lyase family enzyme